jgi:hypothetical protein
MIQNTDEWELQQMGASTITMHIQLKKNGDRIGIGYDPNGKIGTPVSFAVATYIVQSGEKIKSTFLEQILDAVECEGKMITDKQPKYIGPDNYTELTETRLIRINNKFYSINAVITQSSDTIQISAITEGELSELVDVFRKLYAPVLEYQPLEQLPAPTITTGEQLKSLLGLLARHVLDVQEYSHYIL